MEISLRGVGYLERVKLGGVRWGVGRGYDMVLLFLTSDFFYTTKKSLDQISSSIKGQIDDQV